MFFSTARNTVLTPINRHQCLESEYETLRHDGRPVQIGTSHFKSTSGNTSKIDHVLVKNRLQLKQVRYVSEPFWSIYTDHAALVVDIATW